MSEQPVTIVVSMEGGVVHDVSSNAPVRVVIMEYDKNQDPREDPERIIAVHGYPQYFQDWLPLGKTDEQKFVSEIVQIVDQAPHCHQCNGPRVDENWEYKEEGLNTHDGQKTKLCWFCCADAQERRDHDA